MIHPYGSNYLETRVLSATPLELVGLLYEGAIDSIREARRHLAAGNIRDRGRSITKSLEIVGELASSLDRQAGGELGDRLGALYEFIQQSLMEANFRQDEEGLKHAESLLVTLQEAWSQVLASTPAEPVGAAPYLRSA